MVYLVPRHFLALVGALLAVLLAGSILAPSASASSSSARKPHHFAHASTCGDYDSIDGEPANTASSVAAAGRDAGYYSGCLGEDNSGRWVSDTPGLKATFRWYLGSQLIRKKKHQHCGGESGCRDTLRWKHSFTVDDSGDRFYGGKKLTLTVVFKARGFATKSLHTSPAYDSGYAATGGDAASRP
jgi:hypothetical protein